MDKEPVSLWADVKKYEDMLANDPKSYCFALLSEFYRKLGLLDDAVNTANRGIEIHPEYVGGYMAAGRAYFEKGMKEESKKALERVVMASPENLLAQKILSQIYVEQGDIPSAIETLRVTELLNPEDVESRLMLENLVKSSAESGDTDVEVVATLSTAGETVISDDEFVFKADGEEIGLFDEISEEPSSDAPVGVSVEKGPLATATLAELYVSQGFLDRAIAVYRELLESEPGNGEWRDRLLELEMIVSGQASRSEMPGQSPPAFTIGDDETDSLEETRDFTSGAGHDAGIISILECWLDNINRGRHAASGDTQRHC